MKTSFSDSDEDEGRAGKNVEYGVVEKIDGRGRGESMGRAFQCSMFSGTMCLKVSWEKNVLKKNIWEIAEIR